jgi:hypothetical protein
VLRERGEEAELEPGERDLGAVDEDAVRLVLDHERAAHRPLRLRVHLDDAAHERLHLRGEHLR